MSSTPSSQTPSCARCKNSASQACNGCKDAPGSAGYVYYCSTACQKADWTNHKELCKSLQARKVLYRAGSILQEVFYIYRDTFFDKAISKVTKTDGKWYIHEGKYGGICSELHVIEPFPSALFPDPRDKRAVLVHLACTEAVACMHELVKDLLSDVVSEFEEVVVVPENNKMELVSIDILGGEDKEEYEHEILKVTLKHGGGCFALDLTGAQYGYHEPVIPWIKYLGTRVHGGISKENRSFGSGFERYAKMRTELSWHGAVVRLNLSACRVLNDVTRDWQKMSGVSLSNMLKSPAPNFEKTRASLVATIYEILWNFKEHMGRQAEKQLANTRSA